MKINHWNNTIYAPKMIVLTSYLAQNRPISLLFYFKIRVIETKNSENRVLGSYIY